ncbi:MAG: glycoside hydrolase family 2 protein, partial [Planctomycetota bacterium]
MLSMDLTDHAWTLTLDRGDAPVSIGKLDAEVPGCLHLDLLNHGLIPDPYAGDNESRLQWINRCDWTYACTFDVDPELLRKEHVQLHFAMLDTVATITLNSQKLGSVANQHHPHTFDVKDHLRPVGNKLVVTFGSPLDAAEANEQEYGTLPHAGHGTNVEHPHNFLRKMSCNMGWDWGPVLMTSGIAGPVDLLAFDTARLEFVRPLTMDLTDDVAKLDVLCDLIKPGTGALTLRARLTDPDGNVAAEREVISTDAHAGVPLEIKQPRKWWPVGQGEQPLYDLHVELLTAAGDLLDSFDCRVGLRSVRLDQSEDDRGSRFA